MRRQETDMKGNHEKIRIAIDGPSGAGKSTIAKKIALALKIDYIDTGAMYRAISYKVMKKQIQPDDQQAMKEMLENTVIDFDNGNIILDGQIINEEIRTPAVTKMSSVCSALPEVREKLVTLQRNMGQAKSIIMDGRDIGTNVLTDAEYKFYLTASVQERALRRWKELKEKGQDISIETVEADIAKRDHDDSTRTLNPLRKAVDAVEIDTTGMTIEEVINFILDAVKKGGK